MLRCLNSESNPAYRRWLKLATSARAVRELGLTLAEGLHLAKSAIEVGASVEAVLLRRGSGGAALDRCLADLPASVRRYELAAALYDRLAPVEHGMGLTLVVGAPLAPLPSASMRDLVYLDGVQDPLNVGALLRSAAAAGVAQVLCSPTCAGAWAPKAMRAGMGAQFRLKLSEGVDADALRSSLQGDWVAAVVRDAPSLWDSPLPPGPVGWAFGSEGAGLSEATLARCRQRLMIPMASDSESLNVAAAAAICLFERRRRLQAR